MTLTRAIMRPAAVWVLASSAARAKGHETSDAGQHHDAFGSLALREADLLAEAHRQAVDARQIDAAARSPVVPALGRLGRSAARRSLPITTAASIALPRNSATSRRYSTTRSALGSGPAGFGPTPCELSSCSIVLSCSMFSWRELDFGGGILFGVADLLQWEGQWILFRSS